MAQTYKIISDLCKDNGINITELCRNTGVSRGTMTDFKMGRSKSLSADTLDKIAAYFHVSVDYLLGRTPDPIMISDFQNNKAPTDDDVARAYYTILHSHLDRAPTKQESARFKQILSVILEGIQDKGE